MISITNFHQDERSMLKHLIVRTGARYTDYLTQKNTVLICKRCVEFVLFKFDLIFG